MILIIFFYLQIKWFTPNSEKKRKEYEMLAHIFKKQVSWSKSVQKMVSIGLKMHSFIFWSKGKIKNLRFFRDIFNPNFLVQSLQLANYPKIPLIYRLSKKSVTTLMKEWSKKHEKHSIKKKTLKKIFSLKELLTNISFFFKGK